MKQMIKNMSFTQFWLVFGIAYAILTALVTIPWFYLGFSGLTQVVLGMPISLWYWILNSIAEVVFIWVLYLCERVRHELDLELLDAPVAGDQSLIEERAEGKPMAGELAMEAGTGNASVRVD